MIDLFCKALIDYDKEAVTECKMPEKPLIRIKSEDPFGAISDRRSIDYVNSALRDEFSSLLSRGNVTLEQVTQSVFICLYRLGTMGIILSFDRVEVQTNVNDHVVVNVNVTGTVRLASGTSFQFSNSS